MSSVTLTIGGRPYTVACADGEEAHVSKMGAMVDDRLAQMGSNLSPNEAKNLVFAALILADELHEAGGKSEQSASSEVAHVSKIARLEEERDRLASDLTAARRQLSNHEASGEAMLTETLERLAELTEKSASALESKVAAS